MTNDDDEARQRAIARAYQDLADRAGKMTRGWVTATVAHAYGITPEDVAAAVERVGQLDREPKPTRWWRRMMGRD